MSKNEMNNDKWHQFHGPNLGYMLDLYEHYQKDPESVDPSVREWFEQSGAPGEEAPAEQSGGFNLSSLRKTAAAVKLAEDIRTYGHLQADIYPFEMDVQVEAPYSELGKYGLTEEDLKAIPAQIVWETAPSSISNALEAIEKLKEVYTKTIAFEFHHVHDKSERQWLTQMVETGELYRSWTNEERKEVLSRLIEVDGFEKFLHKTFVGQKRFSIEGVDMLVPMLDEIIKHSCVEGTNDMFIGMAHRGRLNVLAHVLGKPYELIFSEFHKAPNKELVPSEGSMGINYGWTGDVKYHLGANRNIEHQEESCVRVNLANNPSHLEFVDPVVEGYTRAAQEDREEPGFPKQDIQRALAILIHGDAAFPGEGVVTETLNLSRLKGYETGGTIHIIANNLVGFTTDRTEARSTKYASDVAKGYEIPIVRVNADDPEACIAAINLAHAYRKKFKRDFLIDLVGYRRFGHNEMDDPTATQPLLYKKINNHPTVKTRYGELLVEDGVLEEKELKAKEENFERKLFDIYENVKDKNNGGEVEEKEVPKPVAEGIPEIQTGVPLDTLKEINKSLLQWPEEYKVYPKLAKILKRRESAFEDGNKVDWALAETMAFATILANGTPIRLTGQDSQRGTFAHRHIVLHDVETNKTFSPLHHFPQAKASFAVYNSPLTETAVLGFEYGYSVETTRTLVLWEAQYGDFVNVAQVIMDQFISAGRAKWGQKSSLVMLLPHGFEGQGPEHSSARLERFLTLAAENNWTIANLTSAAQYFHILRRQAAITTKEEARPLILMAPKSLIRNQKVASPGEELSGGRFKLVMDDPNTGANEEKVERLVLTSGKVAIDLTTELEKNEDLDTEWLHIARVEQLYPFPEKQIRETMERFPNLKEIVWVQEEPRNMGSWHYIYPRLRELVNHEMDVNYIGRPDRSSPATGEPDIHKREQQRIVNAALTKN
ncbi:2-oxoglutarate dehydrogenase E1 component [Bacillus tianshenii]|nr:2-oxoglutarate dehydrogenase E1 component [Bacillus tianshenii]